MKARNLKVLIVEDDQNDALLLVHALKDGGWEPLADRVYTSEMMREALRKEHWDLILSDHAMPQFNATQALAICRESGLDTPFIIVSGRIGEECAVALMRAGAHDYVRKDDLNRLVPAVRRELESARERYTRKRAESEMTHLASIVESCQDAIVSHSLDGTILSWNAGAENVHGYSAEEAIGRSVSMLVPPDGMDELLTIFGSVSRGERLERFETVRLRKDNSPIDVSMTVSPIKGVSGQVTGASIVERDVTARKREEEERVRLIQELSDALARVKTLSGLLPICSSCKKIRNDHGYWEQVEIYIQNRSRAEFTHGICPDCMKRLYSQYEAKA